MAKSLRVCLAALKQRPSVPEGVEKLISVLHECRDRKVDIVCTPETYLPGLRGATFDLPDPDQPAMERALRDLRASCRETGVAIIAGMEWQSELGITPGGESENYVPDGRRRVFTVKGVTFGITICHEGWRYPETVRWPAVRGAQIVFQPQVTGSDEGGQNPRKWGESFYEKAMQCRAGENNVYFASVNQAMKGQNSATSLIDPQGNLIEYVPCGKEDLLIADLDIEKATRFYTSRYRSELYPA